MTTTDILKGITTTTKATATRTMKAVTETMAIISNQTHLAITKDLTGDNHNLAITITIRIMQNRIILMKIWDTHAHPLPQGS